MKFYHLSQLNLDQTELIPKIPQNFMTKNGYEDSTIPRICVAPSLDHCILGIGYTRIKEGNKRYYVHEPISYKNITSISNDEIISRKLTPDAEITKEHWILTPHKFKCIGYIDIVRQKDEYISVYVNDKEITKHYFWEYSFFEF